MKSNIYQGCAVILTLATIFHPFGPPATPAEWVARLINLAGALVFALLAIASAIQASAAEQNAEEEKNEDEEESVNAPTTPTTE